MAIGAGWADGAWVDAGWINGAWAGADVTAPVLSNPTGTATGATTASGTVDTDETGTLYFWATNSASETAAAIKSNGDSQSVTAIGTQNVSVTNLAAETEYYLHYVQDDPSSNESNVVASALFQTAAADELGGGWARPRKVIDRPVNTPSSEDLDELEEVVERAVEAETRLKSLKPRSKAFREAKKEKIKAEKLFVEIYKSIYPELKKSEAVEALEARVSTGLSITGLGTDGPDPEEEEAFAILIASAY